MRSRLMTWRWLWDEAKRAGSVRLNLSDVEFMEPWALAMFTSFAITLRASDVTVEIVCDPANPSNLYLESMGLSEVVQTRRSTSKWDDSNQNTAP